MKILLDIDGVMIPARPWQALEVAADGFGMFSKHAVEGLNHILQVSPDAEVILTTSHKHSHSLKEWKSIFSSRGIHVANIDRLSSDSLTTSRIDEIRAWYLKHQNEDFIVMDDDKGLNALDSNFKDDHLILTSPAVGLNRPAAEEAVRKIQLLQETSE